MSELESGSGSKSDRLDESLPLRSQPIPATDRFEQFKASSSQLFYQTALVVFPRRWLRNGLAAVAIGLASMGGGWLYFNRQVANPIATKSNLPPLSVSTFIVPSQAIAGTQPVTGTVEPIEVVAATSRVTGQIISLPIKVGDRVKAGQVLAKIDVRNLISQQDRSGAIVQAISSVNVAQSALNQAVASENQIVAQIDRARSGQQQTQAQYRNAIAQNQSVQVELNNARLTQQRRVTLHTAGAIGRSSLDMINTQVTLLNSRLQQGAETIAQAKTDIAENKASITHLQAAQASAHTLVNQSTKIVAQAQAQVKQTKVAKSPAIANLRDGIVTAPFSGVVTQKFTEVGAIVSAGQSIVTVENTARQRFSVDVPESARSQIKLGNLVKISFEGIPGGIQGKVDRVMPTANLNSHSFNAKIALAPNTSLRSGMFGRVALESAVKPGINIPTTALIKREHQSGVYVVGDERAIYRSVKTGTTQNGSVEIVSGLSSGDRVVTSNLDRLKDGQLVNLSN